MSGAGRRARSGRAGFRRPQAHQRRKSALPLPGVQIASVAECSHVPHDRSGANAKIGRDGLHPHVSAAAHLANGVVRRRIAVPPKPQKNPQRRAHAGAVLRVHQPFRQFNCRALALVHSGLPLLLGPAQGSAAAASGRRGSGIIAQRHASRNTLARVNTQARAGPTARGRAFGRRFYGFASGKTQLAIHLTPSKDCRSNTYFLEQIAVQ